MVTSYKVQEKKIFLGANRRNLEVLLASFLIVFFVTTQLAFANQSFVDPLGDDMTLAGLLKSIIKVIIYIMTPIITLMVIYTGFLFVMAQGNPAKLTQARTALMWCLIGAVIVLGAFGISEAIDATITSIKVGTGALHTTYNAYV
jgi:hypothetical protein